MKRLFLATALASVCLATLSAQSASTSPHVYDSTGKLLGSYIATAPCPIPGYCGSVALLSVGTLSVVLPISESGLAIPTEYGPNGQVRFHHTSADCSGQRYLSEEDYGDPARLIPPVAIYSPIGNNLIIPFKPAMQITANSVEIMNQPQLADMTQPGNCFQTTRTGPMLVVFAFNASLLGTPPFSVR